MKKIFRNTPSYVLLSVFSLVSIYPIIWIIFGSLKTSDEIYSNFWGLPRSFHWQNYVDAWNAAQLGDRIGNSVFITIVSLVILIAVSTIAAYSLSRIKFPGNKLIFVFILATMLIPLQVIVVPLFLVIKEIGLLNTRLALILIYTASGIAFSVFLLYGFLKTVPKEPEEASYVDGASRLQVFWHVVLPLIRPGLATVAVFQGMNFWNEFFMALIIVRSPELQTIPLGMTQFFFSYHTDWTLYFAALSIVILPVIILFIAMQRQFIDGLTAGAVKG